MSLLPSQISPVTPGMLVFSTPWREWACVCMYPVSSPRQFRGHQIFAVKLVRSRCCRSSILCTAQQQWNAAPSEIRETMCQWAPPANSLERGILTKDKSLFVVHQQGSRYPKGHPGDGLPEMRSCPELRPIWGWRASPCTAIHACVSHLATSSCVPTLPGFCHTCTSQRLCPRVAANIACPHGTGRCSCQCKTLLSGPVCNALIAHGQDGNLAWNGF